MTTSLRFSWLIVLTVPTAVHAQAPAWRTVAVSPDSRLIAVGAGGPDEPGVVTIWDLDTRKPALVQRAPRGIASVAFSPSGKVLAVGTFAGDCNLLDVSGGKLHRVLGGHGQAARGLAFSPDGKTLAVASYDHNVYLWDWSAGKRKATLQGHGDWVYQVAWSHDGRLLASASADKTARLWDGETGKPRRTLADFPSLVRSVAFGPDDRWLAVGSWNIPTVLFDPASGARMHVVGGIHGDWLTVAPDGRTLAVCSLNSRNVDVLNVDFQAPNDAERTAIEKLVAQLDDDAPAMRDDAGAALLRFGWRADALLQRAVKHPASAEVRLRARRLRVELRAKPVVVLTGHEEAATCAAFTPDGRWLATAGGDGAVVLWDTKSWQKAFVLQATAP